MTIDTTILVLVAFFSVLAGIMMPFIYFQLKLRRLKKAHLQKIQTQIPMFGPIKEGTTCDSMDIGRHDWRSLPLMKNGEAEPKETLVCMKCGVMSGENQQFYPEGLETLKRNIQAMEEQKAFAEEIQQFRKKELEKTYYRFLDTTLLPDDESRKTGLYKKFYDLGVKAVEDVEEAISIKIQQKQQEKVLEMVKRMTSENNPNV